MNDLAHDIKLLMLRRQEVNYLPDKKQDCKDAVYIITTFL